MKKSLGPKTLLYPTPVLIIGSYDEAGRPNLMNAAWGGLCGSEPPAVAVSIRPGRQTHENIMKTGAFTVNIPSADHVKEADYVGLVSGHEVDKFARTGLTALRGDQVNAPLVAEFPLGLECRLLQTVEIGVHTQFIGEILDVKVDESLLQGDGNIDLARLQPFCFMPGSGAYYRVGEWLAKAFEIGRPK